MHDHSIRSRARARQSAREICAPACATKRSRSLRLGARDKAAAKSAPWRALPDGAGASGHHVVEAALPRQELEERAAQSVDGVGAGGAAQLALEGGAGGQRLVAHASPLGPEPQPDLPP